MLHKSDILLMLGRPARRCGPGRQRRTLFGFGIIPPVERMRAPFARRHGSPLAYVRTICMIYFLHATLMDVKGNRFRRTKFAGQHMHKHVATSPPMPLGPFWGAELAAIVANKAQELVGRNAERRGVCVSFVSGHPLSDQRTIFSLTHGMVCRTGRKCK